VIAPYNHVLLLPAALLAIGHWRELWTRTIATRVIAVFCCALAVLPWLLALLFTLAKVVSGGGFSTLRSVPAYAELGLPFAAFGLLFLLRLLAEPPSGKGINVRPDSGSSELEEWIILKDQFSG
jgi:hypothetical protein